MYERLTAIKIEQDCFLKQFIQALVFVNHVSEILELHIVYVIHIIKNQFINSYCISYLQNYIKVQ